MTGRRGNWFERLHWAGERQCGHCQSENTQSLAKVEGFHGLAMQFGSEAERSHEGLGPNPRTIRLGAHSAKALPAREGARIEPSLALAARYAPRIHPGRP